MNVSGPFIRRPVGTSLLAIGLLLLGATAYFFLPVAPLAAGGLPDDWRERVAARRGSGHGGKFARGASRATSGPDRRGDGDDLGKLAGRSQHHRAIRFESKRERRGAGRAGRDQCSRARSSRTTCPSPPTYRKYNPADSPVVVLGDDFADDAAVGSLQSWPIKSCRSACASCRASVRSECSEAQKPPCACR